MYKFVINSLEPYSGAESATIAADVMAYDEAGNMLVHKTVLVPASLIGEQVSAEADYLVAEKVLDTVVKQEESLSVEKLDAIVAENLSKQTSYDQAKAVVTEVKTAIGTVTLETTSIDKAKEEIMYPLWVQPAGASDSYQIDMLVTHVDRKWKSLMKDNSYEPGKVGSWRDQTVPPLWVAPVGSIGAWVIGDEVEHKGYLWKNTSNNNSFEPGVWGWTKIEPIVIKPVEEILK